MVSEPKGRRTRHGAFLCGAAVQTADLLDEIMAPHRVSCVMVRYYVTLYSATAAEQSDTQGVSLSR